MLTALSTQWAEEGEDMGEAGRQVTSILDSKLGAGALKPTAENPPPALLAKLYAQLHSAFDPELGGFSKAPKFPQPSNLLTLLHLTTWKAGVSKSRYVHISILIKYSNFSRFYKKRVHLNI